MERRIKILCIGPKEAHARTVSYVAAFRALGVDASLFDPSRYYAIGMVNRTMNHLLRTPVFWQTTELNRRVIDKASEEKEDIVFFIKPVYIRPETIKKIKKTGARVFAWFPDDIFYKKNSSKDFLGALSDYDVIFTTKTFNVEELMSQGVQKAVFLPHAVDVKCHHPVEVSEKNKETLGADIVFVGTYAKEERLEYLERLCREGYDLRIYGDGWGRLSESSCVKKRGVIQKKAVYCGDLSEVFNASKIVLAFLRKHNRDRQTSRTYEIPGCGAFMLHERTNEATALFKEGEEAEFFSSYAEMKEKIDYYLSHDAERERIAKAGYERAICKDYSYKARAEKVLAVYEELKN